MTDKPEEKQTTEPLAEAPKPEVTAEAPKTDAEKESQKQESKREEDKKVSRSPSAKVLDGSHKKQLSADKGDKPNVRYIYSDSREPVIMKKDNEK